VLKWRRDGCFNWVATRRLRVASADAGCHSSGTRRKPPSRGGSTTRRLELMQRLLPSPERNINFPAWQGGRVGGGEAGTVHLWAARGGWRRDDVTWRTRDASQRHVTTLGWRSSTASRSIPPSWHPPRIFVPSLPLLHPTPKIPANEYVYSHKKADGLSRDTISLRLRTKLWLGIWVSKYFTC